MDWLAWHAGYDDPSSGLSARLRRVQAWLARALDRAPPGPLRLVSLCAGQGHDVIGVLPGHPRRDDVRAVLIEADPHIAGQARHAAEQDIQRTVEAAPAMCQPGATVIWTRHREPPDPTPRIRAWFTGAGFDEVAFDAVGTDGLMSVGVARLARGPAGRLPDGPLFTFGSARRRISPS
ncbi:MAG TPA: hypothetical protein VHY31_10150 [Streptosporangiaceae bacterium]|jgi:hypothetical protein|nr:hypothetical protein [Streptosporangiaceae bacterium]